MPSKSSDLFFPEMKRVQQETEAFCGPAVLVMLASFWGKELSQNEVVAGAGVERTIEKHGMKLADLEKATLVLMPELSFWHKKEATMSELSKLVNDVGYPVGVEWQGIFETDDADDEFEDPDDDPGHYSVVTGISLRDNWITMADPYHNRGVDKHLTVLAFERRWWDINEVIDDKSGKRREIDDYKALFGLAPKGVALPVEGLLGSG